MLRMSVMYVIFMAVICTVTVGGSSGEVEGNKNNLDDTPILYSRKDAVLDLVSLVADFAARSTTYSSLLTLNVANVIILALIAFVALGYFGFLDFDSARSMARSASSSLTDTEFMDTLFQAVELAMGKFQHLDDRPLDGQL